MFTDVIIKSAQMAGGVVGGGVIGLGAAAGTKFIGERYLKKAEDPALRERARLGDKDAQKDLDKYNARSKMSFDLRKAPGMSWVQKQTGVDATHGVLGMGSEKSFEGGAHEAQEKAKKKAEEKYKTYEMTAEEKAEQKEKWQKGFDATEEVVKQKIQSEAAPKFNNVEWNLMDKGDASTRDQRREDAKKEFTEKAWNEKKDAFKKSYESGDKLDAYGLAGQTGVKKVDNASLKKEEAVQRSNYFENKKSSPKIEKERQEQEKAKREKEKKEFEKNFGEGGVDLNGDTFEKQYKTLTQETEAKIAKVREDGELKKFKENFEAAGGTFDKAKEDKFREDFNSRWGKNKRKAEDLWSRYGSLPTMLSVGALGLVAGAPVAATTYVAIKGLSLLKDLLSKPLKAELTNQSLAEAGHTKTEGEKTLDALNKLGVNNGGGGDAHPDPSSKTPHDTGNPSSADTGAPAAPHH
jgi:hypothetical protein